MPTVLILIFTLFVMVTVIPYAFSSVIKQLQGVWAMEEQSKYFPNLLWTYFNSISEEAEAALKAAADVAAAANPQEVVQEITPCTC